MADRVEERIQQPLLDRALRRIRSVWSDLGFSRSARRQPSGPNLPPKDLRKVEALMLGCLREQSVATAARAQAAKLGYIYLTLNEAGRRRFLLLLTRAFDLDARRLAAAAEAYVRDPDVASYAELRQAVRPARVQLLTMLNSLPDGFKFLVDLRADLICCGPRPRGTSWST